MIEGLSAPLPRLKALIWVHSLIGAGLVIAFFAVISRDLPGSVPIVGCGIAWVVALGPIEKRASALKQADRIAATGLPGAVRALLAVAQLGSLAAPRSAHPEWMVVGHLLVGGTLLFRGFLSTFMEVPMHRRTWATCLLLLGVGLVRHLGVLCVEAAIRGC
jgi:hypothetical protein